MGDFEQIFLDEAHDLLQQLEAALLTLEREPTDPESITRVFRVMHSLKGTGGMFGYTAVADITHHLESLFDVIREGRAQLTSAVAELVFRVLDHLPRLLADRDLTDPSLQQAHSLLLAEAEQAAAGLGTDGPVPHMPLSFGSGQTTWHVFFRPPLDILRTGNRPIRLVEELQSLAPDPESVLTVTHLERQPAEGQPDPDLCYPYWELYLCTYEPKERLREVFLFVESYSEVSIEPICPGNLPAEPAFRAAEADWRQPGSNLPAVRRWLAEQGTTSATQAAPQSAEPAANKGAANAAGGRTPEARTEQSIRVPAEKLDSLLNLVSELVTVQAKFGLYAQENHDPALEAIVEAHERLARQLRETVFGLRLVPIRTLFGRFDRLVRDLTNDLGKWVQLETAGGDTELDKSVIEALADPLMHLLRNALDHGLETPDDRIGTDKEPTGRLRLAAGYAGNAVVIEISDDGRGIDPARIRARAIERGLATEETQLSDADWIDFIFRPGFSTAEAITSISGRGVGMDVVRKRVEELHGEVNVTSELGRGTRFSLTLPLTLSIIDGLLVRIHDTHYVLPLNAVQKCYLLPTAELRDNLTRTAVLDGRQVPLLRLRREFGVKAETPPLQFVVAVRHGEREAGLTVDHIVGEHQTVLKPLGAAFRQQQFLSGSSILGDGTVALVLDTNRLLKDMFAVQA